MINPLYEPLPDTVIIDYHEYEIVTDFREWTAFADMIADSDLSSAEKTLMMSEWFVEPPEIMTKEAVESLFSFYRASALEQPKLYEDDDTEKQPQIPVLNWKIDAPYIIGDFQRYYGIDLLSENLHWWRFRILFNALPSESQMMKRMGYRSADLGQIKNESERKRIMKMKQLYSLPFELDDDAIGDIFDSTM